jgi:ribosomal protein L11
MDEKTQLEVRKFLKRLGINSQEKLQNFIQENPSIKDIPIKVSFEINGKQDFTFEDKIKI